MENLLKYDLFIFDFDGTLIDTEYLHCKALNNALFDLKPELKQELNSDLKTELKQESSFSKSSQGLSMEDYHNYFHNLNTETPKITLKALYKINDYQELYDLKQKYYINFVKNETIEFIKGAREFLNFIIENNKKFIIVSNTSDKFIEIFKEKHPILKCADKIYTKEYFINRKPNPECYLKVVNDYKNENKIGFEDSYIGMHSLYQVNDITPVFIDHGDYFYRQNIYENYQNIIICKNFNITDLNNKLENNILNNNLFIDNILNNNIEQFKNNFLNMSYTINQISKLVNALNNSNHIYLSGMGKSGYVCKKSASTWQSLSIKCSYVDLSNLPHGDFGIFRDGDILILISNSGNTEEIIYILKYLKYNLKKKINTISIVANKDSEMEKLSNFTYVLNNITESDEINMTPSTSSLIFMALLDGIAINVKKDITKEEFQIVHPAGTLGKK